MKAIEGTVLVGEDQQDLLIDRAFAADLLSDVLALSDERTTLITGMINPQVLRVAEILNVTAVIFVRGKVPPPALVKSASELNIPLIITCKTMFETCGRMYANGVHPCRTVGISESGNCE
ncbi:hypothetical protein KAH43_07590 [Candidatus Bipolaricaulota bacterium]|nr:hypothetical protein [Candidatus Bipolaricaulota bacterium]